MSYSNQRLARLERRLRKKDPEPFAPLTVELEDLELCAHTLYELEVILGSRKPLKGAYRPGKRILRRLAIYCHSEGYELSEEVEILL